MSAAVYAAGVAAHAGLFEHLPSAILTLENVEPVSLLAVSGGESKE